MLCTLLQLIGWWLLRLICNTGTALWTGIYSPKVQMDGCTGGQKMKNWKKFPSTMVSFYYFSTCHWETFFFPNSGSVHSCLGVCAFLKVLAQEVTYDEQVLQCISQTVFNFPSNWVLDRQSLANYWLGFKELTNGGYNIQANQLFQSQSQLYSDFIRIDVWNKLHYLWKKLASTADILYCCLKAVKINARSFILVTQHSNLGSDKLVYWRETLFCLHSRI